MHDRRWIKPLPVIGRNGVMRNTPDSSVNSRGSRVVVRERFADERTLKSRWIFEGGPKADLRFGAGENDGAGAAYVDYREGWNDWRLLLREPVALQAGEQYALSALMRRNLGYGGVRLVALAADGNPSARVAQVDFIKRLDERHAVSVVFAPREDVKVNIGVLADGFSEIRIEEVCLRHNRPPLPPYVTGIYLRGASPHVEAPYRTGAFFEAEDIVANPEAVSESDADEDRLWALCRLNPDRNFWLFSEDTVIKSDSRSQEEGGKLPPLVLRVAGLLKGPYQVLLSDPGRDAAISLNGTEWRRVAGGAGEIDLGLIEVNGPVEIKIAHRYKTAANPGPIYVDYLRFMPVYDAAADLECPVAPPPVPCSPPVQRTSLRLANTWGLQRRGEWVTAGIPFVRGAFRADDGIVVEGVSDIHARPLVFWPDGSVKWLRLEGRADIPADPVGASFDVSYGREVPRARSTCQATRRSADGWRLRSGPVEILVRDGIWDRILFHGREMVAASPAVRLRTPAGLRSDRLRVESVELEKSGPHPTLRVRGRLADSERDGPLAFSARLEEAAPQTLGLQFGVVNEADERYRSDQGCGPALPLTELVLVLDGIAIKPAVLEWPVGRKPFTGVEQKLVQTGAGRCVAEFDGSRRLLEDDAILVEEPFITAHRLPGAAAVAEERFAVRHGWVDLRQDDAGVAVGVRDFAERCPKSIAVLKSAPGTKVEIGILPFQEGVTLRYAQGTRLGVDLALCFHDGRLPAAERSACLAAVLEPIQAVLPPEYYCATGVFGPLSAGNDTRFDGLHAAADRLFEMLTRQFMSYGIQDWGDFFDGCCYVRTESRLWTNMEWNYMAYVTLDFARGGDPARLACALHAARHFVDIDIIHYSTKPAWRGGSYQHSGGALEGHQVGGPDFAHAGWPEGLLWVYYLTGDERLREAAIGLADYVVRNMPPQGAYRQQPAFSMWNCKRQAGNPILTLASVYEISRDPVHLAALHRLVDFAFRVQDLRFGCWSAPFYEEPMYHRPSASWGTDLERGLYRYWELTGDARVINAFQRLEPFLLGAAKSDTMRYFRADSEFRKAFLFLAEAVGCAALFSADPGALRKKAMALLENAFSEESAARIRPRELPGYISGGLRLIAST